jgi:hypothetical protein
MEVIKTVEDWVRLGVSTKVAETLLIKNPDLIDKLQNIDTGDVTQNELNDIKQQRLITDKLLENNMGVLMKIVKTYDFQLHNDDTAHVIPLVVNEVHRVSRQKAYVLKKTEDELHKMFSLAVIELRETFSKEDSIFIAALNSIMESYIISIKEKTFSVLKEHFEQMGGNFMSKIKYYNLVNQVVDKVYPSYNPNWYVHKKHSTYMDPDDHLMSF